MPRLIVEKEFDAELGAWRPAATQREVEVTGDRCVLGRTDDADLVLRYHGVSRAHAAVERRGDGWIVQDLGSSNGTFLADGERIAGEHPLEDGSVFTVPGFLVRFRDAPSAEDAEEPRPTAKLPTEPLPAEADRPPYVILVLQGGGGKAAYQVGVVEALVERGLRPDWVLGISSGAINAAVLAGNAPGQRLPALRRIWTALSVRRNAAPWSRPLAPVTKTVAALAQTVAKPGFFAPRALPPFLHPAGTDGALSLFSNEPLRRLLLRHCDFERIHGSRLIFENTHFQPGFAEGPVPEGLRGEAELRLTIAAADVGSGRMVYFDSRDREDRIGPEHVQASGALPPGAAPVRIRGRLYWDAGLVANNPLDVVIDELLWGHLEPDRPTLIVMVDLWGQGDWEPRTLGDVMRRSDEINYMGRVDASLRDFRRRVWLTTMERKLQELGCLPLPRRVAAAVPGRPHHRTAELGRLGLLHVESGRGGDLGPLDPLDFSWDSVRRRAEDGREDTLRALARTPWQEDLAAGEPAGRVHRVRRGEYLGVSKRLVPLAMREPGRPFREGEERLPVFTPKEADGGMLSELPPMAADAWSQMPRRWMEGGE